MSFLFVLMVLLGFIAMLCHKLSVPRLPEWPAWALWLVAAFLWALPRLNG